MYGFSLFGWKKSFFTCLVYKSIKAKLETFMSG